MKTTLTTSILSILTSFQLLASVEAGTHFNIFIPPASDNSMQSIALIVTAIHDSTFIDIEDEDQYRCYNGMLMAGESYVSYINESSDKERQCSPTLAEASRGDYFTVNASKAVYAHRSGAVLNTYNYVASTDEKGVGKQFIIHVPIGQDKHDLNVLAHEAGTQIIIKQFSVSESREPKIIGINSDKGKTIINSTLNPGEDLIYAKKDGKRILKGGHTYLIESSADVTVQYGQLTGTIENSGVSIPASNGNAKGELFYFTVPAEDLLSQEVRIFSGEERNMVIIERYENGSWEYVKSWILSENQPAVWRASDKGEGYETVFRVRCESGKAISVSTLNTQASHSLNHFKHDHNCKHDKGYIYRSTF